MSLLSLIKPLYKTVANMILPLLVISTSVSLNANDMNYDMNCCPSVCCEQAPMCDWSYNPPGHMKCSGSNSCGGFLDNLSGRADFLWWRPCSGGTQLGISEQFVFNRSSGQIFQSEVTHEKNLNFKFDPGFRLGLGYYCPSNCWDIALNWTHFHSKARAEGTGVEFIDQIFNGSSEFSSLNFDAFLSAWDHDGNTDPFLQDVTGRWTLDLDMIDLEFAQKYYVNHCFVVRPHIGLRFGRIDQNYHIDQFAHVVFVNEDDEGMDVILSSPVKAKNDFRGIGPRIGLDLEFHIGCGFVLFGKGAASLVYGKFTRDTKQILNEFKVETFLEEVGEPTFVQTVVETYSAKGSNDRCTVPMSEVSIGLLWEHCFECCNRYYPFALSIAWEQNAFYDLNHFSFVPNSSENDSVFTTQGFKPKTGDLTTQGLTISAVIGF